MMAMVMVSWRCRYIRCIGTTWSCMWCLVVIWFDVRRLVLSPWCFFGSLTMSTLLWTWLANQISGWFGVWVFMSTWLSSLISQFVATHVIMCLHFSVIRSMSYVVGRYLKPIDYSEMTRMWTVYIHQVWFIVIADFISWPCLWSFVHWYVVYRLRGWMFWVPD